MSDQVGERYRAVVGRVARAAERSGRDPATIAVLAAAKSFPPEAVAEVVRAGCRDIGENYVQEARHKREAIGQLLDGGVTTPLQPRWHLIGRLQRNKARHAMEVFDVVHSLDSVSVAKALDRAAGGLARSIDSLVEVNVAGEATKGGISADRLGDFLTALADFPRLRVRGLMTIPPASQDPRAFFRRLRDLRDRHADLPLANVQLKELSMGMSADFEAAVEEGATIVRVGRAIFGERN